MRGLAFLRWKPRISQRGIQRSPIWNRRAASPTFRRKFFCPYETTTRLNRDAGLCPASLRPTSCCHAGIVPSSLNELLPKSTRSPEARFFLLDSNSSGLEFFWGSGLARAEGPAVNPAREGGDFETP